MPTLLPPRRTNPEAVDLSMVMFTLVAAILTMLIALVEISPSDAAFTFAPANEQHASVSSD
jgi:hypothetical protein